MTNKQLRLWEFIKDFVSINLGMAIYSLGWAAFLLPYHITTGGVPGLLAIVYYLTKFPISIGLLIINGVLLLIAIKPLGWKFVAKTAYAVLALSTFLSVGQEMMTDQQGNLVQILGEGQDSMACVLGAILNGLGIGIVFLAGGSYLDLVVIGSCWPIFKDWRMVVFGYVTLAVYTYALDLLVNSTRQDTQFIIFTNKSKEICDRIVSETVHSVTILNGEGYYSHQDIKVLITIVHKSERIQILRMIQEIDPAAFVSQSRAEGVYGNGFNAIKA